MDEAGNDELITSLPIHLTNTLGSDVQLHQFPLLIRPLETPPSAVRSGKRIAARIKPNSRRLEIHVPADARSEVWNPEKAKELGAARLDDDREKNQVPKVKMREGEEPRLSEIRMRSEEIPQRNVYMLGIVRDGKLHLHPVTETHQFRPTLTYLDSLSRKNRRGGNDSDSDDGPPPDPDDPTPVAMTKKAKKPVGDAKEVQVSTKGGSDQQAGMSAVRREMLQIIRNEEDENWEPLEFCDVTTDASGAAFESIFSTVDEPLQCKTVNARLLIGDFWMPSAFFLHQVAMSQASETESESSCEEALAPIHKPLLSGGNGRMSLGTITHEQVLRAIHDIDTTSARFSAMDENASRRALEQWKILQAFMEYTLASLSTSAEPRLNDNQLFVTGLLMRDAFLAHLFRLREGLDNQNPKPDGFLSTLHVILRHILTLSGILCTDTCGNADSFAPKGLQQIQERDLHNSINNLPRGWYSLPKILDGKAYSPVTQRCGLTLLFIAYVVGPQLGNDPPPESSHKVVLDHLYQCIDESLDGHSFLLTTGNPEQSQLTLATFICLFSTVHTAVFRDTSSDNGGSSMRPRSFGFLLEVIITIFGCPFGETALPLQSLTRAQRLCLRWGNVIPWTWSVWQDRRAANSEAVIFLTSTWIYHRDAPFKLADHPTISLQGALKQCRSASTTIIQELLHCLNRTICVSSPAEDWETQRRAVFKVLIGCISSFINLLLDESLADGHGRLHGFVSSCCESMLGVFCYAGDEREELVGKGLILEALSFIEGDQLKRCIRSVLSSKTVQFLTRLDLAISSRIQEINRGRLYDEMALERWASALHFIQLLWLSDPTLVNMFTGKYLAVQAIQLCCAMDGSPNCTHFKASAIGSASLLGNEFPAKHRQALDAVVLDVAQGPQDLPSASALALFAIKMQSVDGDVTLGLAIWDYLGTCLSAILSRSHLCEDKALALILSSLVCCALSGLMAKNVVVERFAMSSPWTLSISGTFRALLKEKKAAEIDEYSSALRNQVRVCGSALLRQLDGESQGQIEAGAAIKLVYVRGRKGDGKMVGKVQLRGVTVSE